MRALYGRADSLAERLIRRQTGFQRGRELSLSSRFPINDSLSHPLACLASAGAGGHCRSRHCLREPPGSDPPSFWHEPDCHCCSTRREPLPREAVSGRLGSPFSRRRVQALLSSLCSLSVLSLLSPNATLYLCSRSPLICPHLWRVRRFLRSILCLCLIS